jgi:hypothetical protein
VQLRRDIAGLFLHPVGVVLPGREQAIDIFGRDGEDVDQNGGRSVGAELLLNRHAFIERT